ncbi:unnamed protein product [Eruca vesicaria subsp. sativa]|uniref:Uncharacterized protein n=1 Tax=Eruca vesicaria subsp. sativa TaxID=29727 RepID=A0ABC8M0X5_ERUVS|nr:unnamed protein product [Eruca vesicaria subsp. sativa]
MARYPIIGAAGIPYLAMVIRGMFNDVPVPTYRQEKIGRMTWLLTVMIVMYCISYHFPTSIKFESCFVAIILIETVILMKQLNWPAEDFTSGHLLFTLVTGVWFSILGIVGTLDHWPGLILSLLYFPVWFYVTPMLDDRPSGLEHQYHRI